MTNRITTRFKLDYHATEMQITTTDNPRLGLRITWPSQNVTDAAWAGLPGVDIEDVHEAALNTIVDRQRGIGASVSVISTVRSAEVAA